jgi:Response regulators consisting of a CheY-like receiver domain and a winged-helix DNA-binding domain
MEKKILVVEDDFLLNRNLSFCLSKKGYLVKSALSVVDAKKHINDEEYDLIILDVNLPDGNGFDLCKEIKSYHADTVLIFLTANDMESDMIKGFELGADDYVTKPFPINVLQKKIDALFSRIKRQNSDDYYDDGNLFIDFSKLISSLNGQQIDFTPMEYRTLKMFVSNKKNVLTRQTLLEKLWDVDENFVDEHTLTTTVSRIRNKIEKNGFKYIKTVYSMGYMWMGGGNE